MIEFAQMSFSFRWMGSLVWLPADTGKAAELWVTALKGNDSEVLPSKTSNISLYHSVIQSITQQVATGVKLSFEYQAHSNNCLWNQENTFLNIGQYYILPLLSRWENFFY